MDRINELLVSLGVNTESFAFLIPGTATIMAALLTHIILKSIILQTINKFVMGRRISWAEPLVSRKILNHLLLVIPALVLYAYSEHFGSLAPVVSKVSGIYIIVSLLKGTMQILDWLVDHFQSEQKFKHIPIKGYVQVITIVIYFISLILIVSIITSTDPKGLLTGLGAVSAVLLLVFKDSIMGFIASVQISANDLCRRGDWIEFPRYKADGEILEVSLYTVKIQNWDMTISNIPTIAFVTDSFKNWRGMEESGGRRIKRSVYIDIGTIKFIDDALIKKLSESAVISQFINDELSQLNDTPDNASINKPTNIGVFRTYIEHYLKHHINIHQTMTLLIRQLPSTENGLPIEIYSFCNDINWKNYEAIQAGIFDHIFAVSKEFELSIFQAPSNNDMKGLAGQGPSF
ncbi:MAG: mechanosensitive ion channel family protein [Gammaproteobacteria bacterium]|nr:mechanosensitive ion channel family protein [Gammaproteobacteria bacterium]